MKNPPTTSVNKLVSTRRATLEVVAAIPKRRRGGSLCRVPLKSNSDEGKRYKTLTYQEKKGNIPNLRNKNIQNREGYPNV